jgi:hypothetical protein
MYIWCKKTEAKLGKLALPVYSQCEGETACRDCSRTFVGAVGHPLPSTFVGREVGDDGEGSKNRKDHVTGNSWVLRKEVCRLCCSQLWYSYCCNNKRWNPIEIFRVTVGAKETSNDRRQALEVHVSSNHGKIVMLAGRALLGLVAAECICLC